ncbi:MAG: UDP-N-acetylmuramate--L-alanine ligase [Candidatus Moranbacteria bacterium]|nr:UDP-N-acetylmuramate--L-alanine ligase [Candidatus Moranbacteria bacterium]
MKITDLEGVENIYMIGIKGVGMVGLAEILQTRGKKIKGSDTGESFFTDQILKRLKVKVYKKFAEKNIKNEKDLDLVIHSTAYNLENNEELQWAQENNVPRLSYPEALGLLLKNKVGIAVCGTHGKTTVTAMLALLMKDAGFDPTALVGSKVTQINSGVLVGDSEYMVIEADEYQNKLAHYNPQMVILTNLDFDHPDYFEDFESYKKVFKDFVRKIPATGTLVVWGESASTLEVAMEARCKIVVYGLFKKTPPAGLAMGNKIGLEGMGVNDIMLHEIQEKFEQAGKKMVEFVSSPKDFKLKVIGQHNLLNATAVLALGKALGISEEQLIKSLNNFEGTARRLEMVGKVKGALIIDDYAHHPEEVKATLEALRSKYFDKNIICVFHPHTFTRTKALLNGFSQSFGKADEVIILDVYGSAREEQGGVSSEELVEKMKMFQQNVFHMATIKDAYEDLKDRIGSRDVVVTMGAGNVCDLAEALLAGKI